MTKYRSPPWKHWYYLKFSSFHWFSFQVNLWILNLQFEWFWSESVSKNFQFQKLIIQLESLIKEAAKQKYCKISQHLKFWEVFMQAFAAYKKGE